jgi:hypothetical protein
MSVAGITAKTMTMLITLPLRHPPIRDAAQRTTFAHYQRSKLLSTAVS